MEVTRENNDDLTAVIHIKLTKEDYIDAVNKQLNDYRRKANMPGFRPGKVPMGMIRKMYGNPVEAEEINKKVSEALNTYILDEDLEVLGYPLPNTEKTQTIDFNKQSEFDFYFDIGLAPQFEIQLNENIKAPYYTVAVTEEEIDKAIADAKVRFGTEEYPETVEEGDGLQGKFTQLDEEGNNVENGHINTGFLRIEDIKLKTILKMFLGKGAGATLVFNPYQAFKDELKTKAVLNLHDGDEAQWKADYRFDVEKVIRLKEAEMGEELYKKVFPNDELKTDEDFRKRLAEDLSKHYTYDTDRQLLADAINKLIEEAGIELPDDFMKRWLLESNKGKITPEQLEQQYDSYAKTIRWQLIEAKLQKEFGDAVIVSEDEVRGKVRNYFKAMGDGSEPNPQVESIIDSVLKNRDEWQRIHNELLDEKFISLFKEYISLDKKEVNSDKFYEIVSNTK